jgi:hypothetical protein
LFILKGIIIDVQSHQNKFQGSINFNKPTTKFNS